MWALDRVSGQTSLNKNFVDLDGVHLGWNTLATKAFHVIVMLLYNILRYFNIIYAYLCMSYDVFNVLISYKVMEDNYPFVESNYVQQFYVESFCSAKQKQLLP